MSESALCKITYLLNLNQQQLTQENKQIQQSQENTVQVKPGMTTRSIAELLGESLGCGYQPEIQAEIKNRLKNIFDQGPSPTQQPNEQAQWLIQMQKIIGINESNEQCNFSNNQFEQTDLTSQLSQKRSSSRYFQTNYDKFFKNRSEKVFPQFNKENRQPIYERSIRKKKETQEKLKFIKKSKLQNEVSQCTFSPNIQNTLEFFNKKNPKFFQQKDHQKQNRKNTFQKLYKQSFDIREKKKQRLKTLQNQQQTKMSELSFIPDINQCSRQICKMKSYASFMSQLSQIHQIQQKQMKSNKKSNKESQGTVKKNQEKIYKFQPEISQNTKKLTKNLPSFYQRLEKSKDKNKIPKQCKSSNNLHKIQQTKIKNVKDPNKLKLKKELYTIDDSFQDLDERQTEKKGRKNQFNLTDQKISQNKDFSSVYKSIQVQAQNKIDTKPPRNQPKDKQTKRSHELFNNRKKIIFQAVFNFLTIRPSMSPNQFSNKKFANKSLKDVEIFASDLISNQFVPPFVKQMFQPIAQQLGDAQISLSKEQFVWATQKLFEGLSLGQRGSLLGWGVKLLPQQIK